MSTATLDYESAADSEQMIQYRALHTGAIIGLVLGIVSVFSVIAAATSLEGTLLVAPIPVLGMAVSIWSLAKIRREPENYTGGTIAAIGLVLSIVFLIGGIAYGGYVYATEVPEGYTRISFGAMKPNESQERSGVAIPPDIAELNGQRVFIKGYIRPDSITQRIAIKKFLLVRDNNQCCFGDLSKVKFYDQVLVDLSGALTVNYKEGAQYRVAGTLTVVPQNVGHISSAPVYLLKADHAN